jgi:hypothetical protein
MVLAPLVAGALEQDGGAQLAYLAVIIPCAAIAAVLIAGARPWGTRPGAGGPSHLLRYRPPVWRER